MFTSFESRKIDSRTIDEQIKIGDENVIITGPSVVKINTKSSKWTVYQPLGTETVDVLTMVYKSEADDGQEQTAYVKELDDGSSNLTISKADGS